MSDGGKEWAQPQTGAGEGAALRLQSLMHPEPGQACPSLFLNPCPLPLSPSPRIRSWGSWLGFVWKKDYPDQSLLISALACALPTVTRTLSPTT